VDFAAIDRVSKIAAEQHGVVTRQDALRSGLSNREIDGLARRGAWRRLFSTTYLVDAHSIGDVPREAWLSAGLQSYGDHAVLIGPTAAEVHRLQGLPTRRDVISIGVVPSTSRRARSAPSTDIDGAVRVQARQYLLAKTEVTVINGLRVTNVGRSIVDTVLVMDRVHGLSILDSALSMSRVSIGELTDLDTTNKGRPGIRQLRELIALADGRAESPLESRIRLACIDAGVPPDELQYPVLDRWGRILGRGDLAWWRGRRRPLIAEADGVGYHDRPEALFRDRHRANDFTLADVDLIRFTWADAVRPAYVISVVRAGLALGAA
jgi:hypothetical protein